jgi:UDP-glucose 4-epimerase
MSIAAELLKRWSGRKVLVTGGAGFLGSAIARTLSEAKSDVIVVDKFLVEGGANRANLDDSAVRLIEGDIGDSQKMLPLLKDRTIVFNLAGRTGHLDSMNDPANDMADNVVSQLSFLEACRKANPAMRLVFTSTRQVYGKPQRLPVDETHPIDPPDINAIHKIAAENYHLLYARVHGLKSTVLRLTNCFGPGMRVRDARQTFVGIWLRKALEDGTVEVWGGEQRRDLLFTDDFVSAAMIAADCDDAMGRVFNLGGNGTVSLSDLAQTLIKIAGRGKIERKAFPAERKAIDIGDFVLADDRFRATTGWKPAVSLEQGLASSVDYYRERLARYL